MDANHDGSIVAIGWHSTTGSGTVQVYKKNESDVWNLVKEDNGNERKALLINTVQRNVSML